LSEYQFHKEALFNRLLEGNLTEHEIDALVQWLGTHEPDEEASRLILEQLQRGDTGDTAMTPEIIARLEARLPLILATEQPSPARIVSMLSNKWMRYAAVLLVFAGIGLFFVLQRNNSRNAHQQVAQENNVNDVAPGKNGAILTLMDGSQVVLDSLGNGWLTTQSGTKVQLVNGQLVYEAGAAPPVAVGYNTMSTPKGRQFQLVLPDGSKVWLNAASSIRYPIVFNGGERKVAITGEAYFEVAHDASKPFRVMVNNETEVEVLGTHFNINAYHNEESINTTLLEGAVRIRNNQQRIVLSPGQQAQVSNQQDIKVVDDVDVEKVMAWKNGVFNFDDASLQEVMRQLERWYDIEVVYEKGVPPLEFYGKMGKDLPLSAVLSGLEKSNVHFRLEEGRKLIVLP
jgi:transmembrane sensor